MISNLSRASNKGWRIEHRNLGCSRVSQGSTWFPTDKCFIDGRWVAAQSSQRLPVEDSSRGIEIAEIARGQAADIDAAVEAAERALRGPWGRLTATERGRLLLKLAELISARIEELARIEAFDVGKPLKQGRADAMAMARYMEFYAGAADKVMGETIPYLDGYTVYTLREPHGVTGHIVPWNYPMQIAGRTIGAALAMGNACVLKPAEEACLTSLALAELAREAGFPAGALNVVPGLGEEAGAALAAHPGVRHLSFTGSVAVGALVQAAAARHVAPVTLELGGKSPQLVFADADLDRALPFLVNAGIQNAGQTCSAASRILVERSRYGEVASLRPPPRTAAPPRSSTTPTCAVPATTIERISSCSLTRPSTICTHLASTAWPKDFKELEHRPEARGLDHAEWLGLLLEYELTLRRQKQFETRARVARLRHPASVEDVNYQSPRGLDRALFLKLAACDWIAERRNLLLTGASGLARVG